MAKETQDQKDTVDEVMTSTPTAKEQITAFKAYIAKKYEHFYRENDTDSSFRVKTKSGDDESSVSYDDVFIKAVESDVPLTVEVFNILIRSRSIEVLPENYY